MVLKLERFLSNRRGTFGRLYCDDDFFCHTLEPAVCDGKYPHGLLTGVYDVIVTYSPKFHCDLPLVNCSRSGIRFHAGNTSSDTRGCILLGKLDGYSLICSKITVDMFTDSLIKVGSAKLIISYLNSELNLFNNSSKFGNYG